MVLGWTFVRPILPMLRIILVKLQVSAHEINTMTIYINLNLSSCHMNISYSYINFLYEFTYNSEIISSRVASLCIHHGNKYIYSCIARQSRRKGK